MHKSGIPMRPITSGIGSAPHRLAKILARPLTKSLGGLSQAHLRNSGDLLERLKELDFQDKKLVSFHVKALFTNVPVEGALKAIKKALLGIPRENLPVPKKDYLALVKLCLKFDPFIFNDNEYAQHEGLAMGSPLSPVAACLFMEMLESEQFTRILGEETAWFRYVDDVLIVAPKELDLQEKLSELNQVHERIQFTLEEEENKTLPFLDTVIIRSENGVKFKVFRKPTNKEDYVHFYSAHSLRTMSGTVIGFFLRAFRICSAEYLEEEINHIFDIFRNLKYPKSLLIQWKNKAKRIERSKEQEKQRENEVDKTSTPRHEERMVIVPHSKHTRDIAEGLKQAGIKIVEKSGIKIGDIVKNKERKTNNENSIVYKIPCGGCSKSYIGETYRGLKTRLSEHKRDFRNYRLTNSMVVHAEQENHLPKWEDAEAIMTGLSKTHRKIFESVFIEKFSCTNHRGGFYTLGAPLCNLACGRIKKALST